MQVTLKHIGTSWWWQQNKCAIYCSDGRNVDPQQYITPNTGMEWEVHETEQGIEGRYFYCSSGQGKRLAFTKLLIPRGEYTSVVHEGKEPEPPPMEVMQFVAKETGWTTPC